MDSPLNALIKAAPKEPCATCGEWISSILLNALSGTRPERVCMECALTQMERSRLFSRRPDRPDRRAK